MKAIVIFYIAAVAYVGMEIYLVAAPLVQQ